MTKTDIDHIDPKWAKGRDFMLVCGLDVVYNICERDRRLNIQKYNRFLPWRNCRDEIGTDPVEQGDLCLFLDPDTDEWVLEEFLGPWWFDKSARYCGRFHRKHTVETRDKISASSKGRSEAHVRAIAKSNSERVWTEDAKRRVGDANRGRSPSEETRRKLSSAQKGRIFTEETRRKISANNRRRAAQKRCRRMAMTDPLMGDFEE